jgi:hypothetical protein
LVDGIPGILSLGGRPGVARFKKVMIYNTKASWEVEGVGNSNV